MLEKIGKFIFKEFFQEIIDDFEKRISELEKQNEILKNYVGNNKSEIRDINYNLKDINKTTAKAEATIQTMLFLSKGRINQLENGNDKSTNI